MADIIKINLNETNGNWETFVEKCLSSCINRNKSVPANKRYVLKYYGDDIDLCLYHTEDDGISWTEIKGIGLDKDTYETGNRSDKDIIESLFNDIKSNS